MSLLIFLGITNLCMAQPLEQKPASCGQQLLVTLSTIKKYMREHKLRVGTGLAAAALLSAVIMYKKTKTSAVAISAGPFSEIHSGMNLLKVIPQGDFGHFANITEKEAEQMLQDVKKAIINGEDPRADDFAALKKFFNVNYQISQNFLNCLALGGTRKDDARDAKLMEIAFLLGFELDYYDRELTHETTRLPQEKYFLRVGRENTVPYPLLTILKKDKVACAKVLLTQPGLVERDLCQSLKQAYLSTSLMPDKKEELRKGIMGYWENNFNTKSFEDWVYQSQFIGQERWDTEKNTIVYTLVPREDWRPGYETVPPQSIQALPKGFMNQPWN